MRTGNGVLFIALDACDATLARQLAARGQMPALAKLLQSAAVAETKAPYGLYVSAQWPTFSTALHPNRHDYYCWVEIDTDSYEFRETTPKEVVGTPFWERLSDAGRTVAIFDVPHTWPSRELNGVMVCEWGCHDRHFGTQSWPTPLATDLADRFGAPPVGMAPSLRGGQFAPCDYAHRAGAFRTPDENMRLLSDLRIGLLAKEQASLALLDDDWDVMVTVLGEGHCAGHQLWSIHDTNHPRHDAELRIRMGDPVVEMYGRLDGALAAHLERVSPDTTVFVYLSHGMQAEYDGTMLLDDVLRRLELAHLGTTSAGWRSRAARGALRGMPAGWRRRAIRATAPMVRRRVASAPPVPPNELDGVERRQRAWYQAPNNTVVGGVRFNVRGREPDGVVVEDDIAELTASLTEDLLDLVNVDTGEAVVQHVTPTRAVYGTMGDAFPDLLVEWNRNAAIERVYSPKVGTVVIVDERWRSGDHTDRGLLLVTGPGIAAGRQPAAVHTVDIGATVCASADVALPDVDGRPIARFVPASARR